MTQQNQSWRVFGRKLIMRSAVHFAIVFGVWVAVVVANAFTSNAERGSRVGFVIQSVMEWDALRLAFLPGFFVVVLLSMAWTCIGIGVARWVSLVAAGCATLIAALYSRFPVPEQAPRWLLWAGEHTPRGLQLFFVLGLAVASSFVLIRHITQRYESLSSDDRLALTPEDEDFANRDLVQSAFQFMAVLLSCAALWTVADIRPVPAVALADARELRPSVIVLATDQPYQLQQLKNSLGPAHFSSWMFFGGPDARAKFDEILQCRYPIRLLGHSSLGGRLQVTRSANDYLLTSALDSEGFSVQLLHAMTPGESSEALKMLSRAYAHVKLFRRFGLLLPSRVFHTPDVQLAQIREALSTAVGRGEPAFVTASMLSIPRRSADKNDATQFQTFLDAMGKQQWLAKLMFVVLEVPSSELGKPSPDLSLQSTTARVSVWMPARLADFALSTPAVRLIRGIDLGASLAARLRLTGVVSQCDGAALFDLSERPSLFPRELVYQELEAEPGQSIFRKRGWLSSDGYRLEVKESHEGAKFELYKFSVQSLVRRNFDQTVDEIPLREVNVTLELNRQLDDFLRSTGVEILQLGNGRVAYSEPFRRIRRVDK